MKKFSMQYPRLIPLWVAVFVDILGFSIILPFLPFFMEIYSSSPIVIGFLLSSNAIFGFFFGPILGKLSDKYGRKPLLLISQFGTLAGFIILALSQNIQMLFIARIVDGIFGGQFPISKAVIGDVVPPYDRPKQMTNIGITFTLAFLIGPAVGGFLSPFGIMGPGILASILAGITLTLTALFVRETLPIKITKDDKFIKESVFSSNKSVLPKPIKSTERNLTSIWKNNQTMIILIQYLFLVIAAGVFQTTFSLFGNIRLNLNPQAIGLLLSSMGIFQVVFRAFLFNKIRNNLGDPKTAMLGLGSFILAYFLLGVITQGWHLVIILFYISFSGATSRGITTGFLSRSVDFRNQGKIMGISSSIDSISQIIGPLIGGVLLAFPNQYLFGIVLSLLSLIPFILSFQVLKFGFDSRRGVIIPQMKNIES
jgi:DHA1 family tetracycline resistance protein-like MFS transporter